MPRSFNSIAPIYAFLEKITFGPYLQRARSYSIEQTEQPIERALLLGDGDGRLALEILKKYPKCRIVSIDQSPTMQAKAREHVAKHFGELPWNYHLTCADARNCAFNPNGFDYIGLHFFLDCFDDEDSAALIENCLTSLAPGGTLSYADFKLPETQPMRAVGWLIIRSLYLCFSLAAGLKVQRLPKLHWPKALRETSHRYQLGGILQNILFTKDFTPEKATPSPAPSPRLKRPRKSRSRARLHPSSM